MRYSKLISALNECAIFCNNCTNGCIESEMMESMKECIRATLVCSELCSSTSKILSVSYSDVGDLIKYCQRTCMYCASECGKHEEDYCQACAQACRKCADACKDELVKFESIN